MLGRAERPVTAPGSPPAMSQSIPVKSRLAREDPGAGAETAADPESFRIEEDLGLRAVVADASGTAERELMRRVLWMFKAGGASCCRVRCLQ